MFLINKNSFYLFALCLFLTFDVYSQENRSYGVFRELPISEIAPEGWLSELLQRQRDGLALNRKASGYPFDSDLWAGEKKLDDWASYEQTAYYLDGIYRCGLLLKDKKLIELGRMNIQYVFDHPQPDGKLGPRLGPISANLIGLPKIDGKLPATQWPFAVFTRLLIAHVETTGENLLLDALMKHYLSLPENFGIAPRDVNNIEGICWLYGKTGDERLIEIAERTWKNAATSPNENQKLKNQWSLNNLKSAAKMAGHGVSVIEQSKQPALLFLATGKKEYLDASLGAFKSMERDHELVDGVVSSDEGLHGKTSKGVHETCDISDYTWSLGYLLEASGEARWADKIERAVFNAGLGALGKDFKAHEYFSSPNQVVATQTSLGIRQPYPTEHINRQAYRPRFITQCCTGNIHRIIPNYAARMWMRDARGGIAAVLYGPSAVHTSVGIEKTPISISEKTDYPFDGKIELKVISDKPVKFPLYLRIPGWAKGATVEVNGKRIAETVQPGTFLMLDRTFANGDRITLNFPMTLRKEEPVEGSVTIVRGPLIYTLKIGEKMTRVEDTPDPNHFPAWDVTATTPWNYGLVLKTQKDLEDIKVEMKPISGFPWTPETTPVVLTAKARRIPSWTIAGSKGETPELPLTGISVDKKMERVKFIPYGATLLRLTVLPEVSDK
ncbi:MAG: glycoside hydrolase family 127 protein [Bacteroidales bacterium]|nr:glycoside hydrolase family 127 protein [Bacteroidales bacterium]